MALSQVRALAAALPLTSTYHPVNYRRLITPHHVLRKKSLNDNTAFFLDGRCLNAKHDRSLLTKGSSVPPHNNRNQPVLRVLSLTPFPTLGTLIEHTDNNLVTRRLYHP